MPRKQKSGIWEERASRKLVFICFLIIIATIICFGGSYLQLRNWSVRAADEIWTNKHTSYDEKIQRQIEAERKLQKERKGE